MLTVRVGFFPLDEQLYLGEHCWTPETVKQIVRQGTEIASHRRAAASFEAMTKIGVSKSSMERLVNFLSLDNEKFTEYKLSVDYHINN